jgi:ribosomal-protein-alanine N-acetyltransferase
MPQDNGLLRRCCAGNGFLMTVILTDRLRMRPLTGSDVTELYALWLNDPDVNRNMESRFSVQTIDSCLRYVAAMNEDPFSHLFGMFDCDSELHIGNIKIGFINPIHQTGEIGLLIGEKSYWGKGFATEAIRALTRWGFDTLNLEKIEAGCYDENLGSVRAFLKAGYSVEGYQRNSYVSGGRRIGSFRLGIVRSDIAKS